MSEFDDLGLVGFVSSSRSIRLYARHVSKSFSNSNYGLNFPIALWVLDLDSFGLRLSRIWCCWVLISEMLNLTVSLLKLKFR
ncbi:hypothetical protein KFK09_001635 [Dendrobium nobile]|uniref:Uncharacterized protein n=1 Tax=Dendrobium nobile TaxID=94219 RepID=A0A8T3CA47_DENNO|nr:hypothetical protein KFK09_001635 [Dendrobium nobile]